MFLGFYKFLRVPPLGDEIKKKTFGNMGVIGIIFAS